MRKLAILSTFLVAFGVAILATAPTADARPCVRKDAGVGDPEIDDLVCCRELSADNPDPSGVADNLGGPDGDQLTCGSIWLDENNFIAGRISAGEETVAAGCISSAAGTTNDVLGGPGCEEDAVAACERGGSSCITVEEDGC